MTVQEMDVYVCSPDKRKDRIPVIALAVKQKTRMNSDNTLHITLAAAVAILCANGIQAVVPYSVSSVVSGGGKY